MLGVARLGLQQPQLLAVQSLDLLGQVAAEVGGMEMGVVEQQTPEGVEVVMDVPQEVQEEVVLLLLKFCPVRILTAQLEAQL